MFPFRWITAALVLVGVAGLFVGLQFVQAGTTSQHAFRSFEPTSLWNAPIPRDAPRHANSAGILEYLRTAPEAKRGCIHLAGAGTSEWGQPTYWGNDGDRSYNVRSTGYSLPPELRSLRIPSGARPARTSDHAMTVYDRQRGYVVALWRAAYNRQDDRWSAGGAQVAYLRSNGLDSRIAGSDDPRNTGTLRGNNGAVSAIRFREVKRGAVRHVIKIASGPEVSSKAVGPIVRSDGSSSNPNAPAQGVRMRLKPSVDLKDFNLHPQARVIARAMKQFGVYVGDSGGVTSMKLENTRIKGRGQHWKLPSTALCQLPLGKKYWEVITYGYDER